MFTLRGRTPPQIPRTPGQPRALAVLQVAELAEADRQLMKAYRRVPQDPAIINAAARLAAENAPAW
jgi:hypothetical protein